ncbi:MAG: HAMP domain-containing protein [Gammaproteobacteria bacterium]|nr:HAMP domain-containing protein [Gammaproteobacteria bacterium]
MKQPRIALVTAVSLLSLSMLASLILMSAAIQNSGRFGTLFSTLLITNCLGLIAFVVLLLINARQLIGQLRRRQPGARLTVRMLIIFVVLSVLPMLVLYGFSVDFLRRGIDSWFDVRIDQALHDALDLSRNALDLRMRELLSQTEKMAEKLVQGDNSTSVLNLDALRNPNSTVVANSWDDPGADLDLMRRHSGADELTLLTQQGRLLESSSAAANFVPNLPSEPILLQLRQGRSYIGLEPSRNAELLIRVAVNIPNASVDGEQRILHALFPLAERMSRLAESVEGAFAQYNELVYLRDKLQLSFVMTLTLVLLSSIATAAWAALYSARRLAAPISDLAAGTAAVAQGDYTTSLPVTSADEIGFLVSSFNAMTRRIAAARSEIETQNKYVNTLLSQLSSGVLALDHQLKITTLNASGHQILEVGETAPIGIELTQLSEFREHLRPFVEGLTQHLGSSQRWQQEVQIFSRGGRKMLMCRGTTVSFGPENEPGHVVVFDDITALIKGQRDAAWSEVAQRLAHEIKNPLTPIQLSAERLRQKYLTKMAPADADTLDRLTSTIVQQVDTMKTMVNTFSDYARPPMINQERIDLNDLVAGVVDLFKSVNGTACFELDFDRTLPPISVDAGRLRQVFNNLIKNALEASTSAEPALITITTRQSQSTSRNHVEVRIADNGEGIKSEMLDTVFEPYVTNKTRGTGLGLAIVKKIIEEHGGMVTLENNSGPGASAIIRLPLDDAPTQSNPTLDRKAS